jgi:tRNA-dihydrouridine synthase 1
MVDQSELAFRLMGRKYGCDLCYTPMLHSKIFSETPKYRREHFQTDPTDRPLVVQFCANNPDTLLRAATMVADRHSSGFVRHSRAIRRRREPQYAA